ncbi:uncharacterized protein NPIL_489701 [Nephila pilipes]|uniref:Uncharacterized protein n=1 Tax=Nephila pilipes TaxID=299642 RepID=A0A8X6TBH3_NEPPI|nr:uncharacterized protein NPIL_489701 [Nephila pilipes]
MKLKKTLREVYTKRETNSFVRFDRLMITFEVLLSFLVVCVELQNSGSKLIRKEEDLTSSNFEAYPTSTPRNFPSLSYTQGQTINHYIYFAYKNYERCITFNYSCNSQPRHLFTFCNISTRYDICWNLTPIWQEGIMDAISRVLSLGGDGSLDIFHVILLTSYHLSLTFLEETRCKLCSSLYVDINFDADYEAVIGKSGEEFQKFTLHHLRALYSKKDIEVHGLSVQRGSIRISFLLKPEANKEDHNMENNFIYSFQVPNHMQIIMKKRLFHLQMRPISEENSKRLFYALDFFKKQMNIKYPSFSHYINKYILNEMQQFSPDRLNKIVPYYEKGNLYSQKKKNLQTDIGSDLNMIKEGPAVENFYSKEKHSKDLHDKIDQIQNSEELEFESRRLLSLSAESPKFNQNSRVRRNTLTNPNDSTFRLKVRFSFQYPITTDANKEEFHYHLKKQLAKRIRVPLSSISDMKIESGTHASFTLSTYNNENNIMDDQTVLEAADFLKMQIRDKKLRLTDLNGQLLIANVPMEDNSVDVSLVILILLGVILFMIAVLVLILVYVGRRTAKFSSGSYETRNQAYRNLNFGRDSSQSVGKYSYDSGLWLGPGSEPAFTVPEAPYYRPPTVEQIASTPRPITAIRTRLKTNWNLDERALSTIPDDLLNRHYGSRDQSFH